MEVFYEKNKAYNCRVKGKPYYRTSITINGKVRQVYGDGKKDALRKIEQLKNEARMGIDLDHKNTKVGELFDYWLFNIKRVDEKIKASSFARYDCAYRNHIKPYPIYTIAISKLNSSVMQEYVTALYEEYNVATASIKATLKVWKMFTKWAVDEGYLPKDPCRNLSIPGKYSNKKKEIEIFSPDERAALQEYMDAHAYWYDTLIKLAFATGMREGELLSLRWDDIYDSAIHINRSTGMVVHVDKNGERERYREVWDTKTQNAYRLIPLLPSTETMLEEHKKAQAKYFKANKLGKPQYVFTTKTGTLIDASNLRSSFLALCERAGVKYRKFHCIRHTFATEAIRRGVNPKDLQMLMGHADIETTYIYVQADESSKRNAISLMGEII